MPGKALSWSAVAVLMSSLSVAVAAAALAVEGALVVAFWATVQMGRTKRRAAARSLWRRLGLGWSLLGGDGFPCGRVREQAGSGNNVQEFTGHRSGLGYLFKRQNSPDLSEF